MLWLRSVAANWQSAAANWQRAAAKLMAMRLVCRRRVAAKAKASTKSHVWSDEGDGKGERAAYLCALLPALVARIGRDSAEAPAPL